MSLTKTLTGVLIIIVAVLVSMPVSGLLRKAGVPVNP